ERRGRRLAAGHRRPRAGDDVPHGRRGDAVERVAGLRFAPDHAPGHAARPLPRPHPAPPPTEPLVGVHASWRGLSQSGAGTEAAWDAGREAQRERARAGAAFGGDGDAAAGGLYQRLSAELPRIEFVGYEALASPARVLAMVSEGRRVREAGEGAEVEVILDRTPAYAESGGQVGDTGTLVGRQGRGDIVDTYYRGGKLIVHRVRVTAGGFAEGED